MTFVFQSKSDPLNPLILIINILIQSITYLNTQLVPRIHKTIHRAWLTLIFFPCVICLLLSNIICLIYLYLFTFVFVFSVRNYLLLIMSLTLIQCCHVNTYKHLTPLLFSTFIINNLVYQVDGCDRSTSKVWSKYHNTSSGWQQRVVGSMLCSLNSNDQLDVRLPGNTTSGLYSTGQEKDDKEGQNVSEPTWTEHYWTLPRSAWKIRQLVPVTRFTLNLMGWDQTVSCVYSKIQYKMNLKHSLNSEIDSAFSG
jgi:hypothetical protein